MRFWNKSKRARAHWHKVSFGYFTVDGFLNDLKLWCQQQPGRGRFFCDLNKAFPGVRVTFVFEEPEDAGMFILKWL